MRFQHVIWDWNGTLLDDTQAGVNAVNAMLAARGLPRLDLATYRERFGFPVKNFYRAVGFRLDAEDWDAMAREFHDRFLADTTIRLHPHALPALTGFQAAGVGQSVLSASEQSILDAMLADFGISGFFSSACGVDNLYGHSKREIGRALLSRFRLDPASVLLIGDSLHDHEVSADLGTACLLIAEGHQSRARLAQSGAPVLGSLAELPEWLRSSPA
jgi:phosphoglycolate phosphatase